MNRKNKSMHGELKTVRDTFESIWVAIILAFVLRAFLVEAFVIPTGSMAEHLMGEHFDLTCPACGWQYSYGWHEMHPPVRKDRVNPTDAHCPNCGLRYPDTKLLEYVNGGDRVLVLKYVYAFSEPKPWDVVVFRNPQSNANNYIKRLIGLPGETIEIIHGDIFVKPGDDEPWQVRRKTPAAQNEMWQIICDNDYRPDMKMLGDMGIAKPRRWEPSENATAWDVSKNNGRVLAFGGAENWQTLEFVGLEKQASAYEYPNPDELQRAKQYLRRASLTEAFVPRYGYDAPRHETMFLDLDNNVDLCSDLRLSAVWKPLDDSSQVALKLAGINYEFIAIFSLAGDIEVLRRPRSGKEYQTFASATVAPFTPFEGYEISLSHVDYTVIVEVNSKCVLNKTYHADRDALKKRLYQAAQKPLAPPEVAIIAKSGPCELWHVKLMRDIYYTSSKLNRSGGSRGPDFLLDHARNLGVSVDDKGWGVMDNPIKLSRHPYDKRDLDEFFVLGDNSPQSLDSRGWIEAAPSLKLRGENGNALYQLGTVPRYNMIGKAMFVYWPAGFRPPLLENLPLIPNVGKMRLIR